MPFITFNDAKRKKNRNFCRAVGHFHSFRSATAIFAAREKHPVFYGLLSVPVSRSGRSFHTDRGECSPPIPRYHKQTMTEGMRLTEGAEEDVSKYFSSLIYRVLLEKLHHRIRIEAALSWPQAAWISRPRLSLTTATKP